MLPLLAALAIGFTGGLRTFAPLFAVRFVHRDWTSMVVGLLLLGELIADKLPNVPARTSLGPMAGRAVVSGYAAWVLTSPLGVAPGIAVALGVCGSIAGAFAGYDWRVRRAPALRLPDLPAALIEDVVAVGGSLCLVLANR